MVEKILRGEELGSWLIVSWRLLQGIVSGVSRQNLNSSFEKNEWRALPA